MNKETLWRTWQITLLRYWWLFKKHRANVTFKYCDPWMYATKIGLFIMSYINQCHLSIPSSILYSKLEVKTLKGYCAAINQWWAHCHRQKHGQHKLCCPSFCLWQYYIFLTLIASCKLKTIENVRTPSEIHTVWHSRFISVKHLVGNNKILQYFIVKMKYSKYYSACKK